MVQWLSFQPVKRKAGDRVSVQWLSFQPFQLDQFINYISFANLIFSQNLAIILGIHFLSTFHAAEQISDNFLFSFRLQRLLNTLSSEITSATSFALPRNKLKHGLSASCSSIATLVFCEET